MVSFKSIVNFFSVNTMLTSLAIVQYTLIENQPCAYSWLLTICTTFVIRNYVLMALIDHGVKHKPLIKNHLTVKESHKHEFHLNVLTSTLVEALTYVIVRMYIFKVCHIVTVGDVIWFIPFSFLLFIFVLSFL